MGKKGIFFDMDGVVIDSAPLWDRIISFLVSGYALDLSVLDRVDDGYNLSTKEAIRLVLEETGRFSKPLFDEIISCVDSVYAAGMPHLTALEPGMSETLGMLKAKGAVMALVSNSSRSQVEMILDYYHLRDCFHTVVTADDVTKGKPDGEPYRRAMELTGIHADEAVAVEDSPTGVYAAEDAGIECLVVTASPDSRKNLYDRLYDMVAG